MLQVRATEFEFRFRLWIGFAIYVLGIWAPWEPPGSTTWLELSGQLARWLPLKTSSIVVTSVALLLALSGTIFRVWGTAYLGSSVVKSSTMHAQEVVAVGPYRYVRNPLYLGSFLFGASVTILMPPSGAIFALIASLVQMLRLILREEPYMETEQGKAYLAYKRRVPRLVPSIVPRVPRTPAQPQWWQAILAEIFYVSMGACFAVLAWRYNANLMIRALLICFGLSLVVRAFAVKRD